MRLFGLVLLSLGVSSCTAGSPPLQCNVLEDKSPTLRLKRHLFCEYDDTIRPVTNSERPTNVSVSVTPQFMDFIDRTSTFILHAWIFLSWKDQHLTWSPEDFDGVRKIRVKSTDIWVPDFSVYNSGNMENSQTGVPSTICDVIYTGTVICIPSIKYDTQCETDYRYWPYDRQNCSIRMGSWTHTGEEISYDFGRLAINMVNYTPHKEWLMVNYTTKKHSPKFSCCPNDTFPTLVMDFDLKRHSPMIHAVFVTPAIVLMVITLTVLWLDSRSVERISIAALNFICHMLCIYDLQYVLPANGSMPPHILLFYRDSLVLATTSMIITAMLRKLQVSKAPAPGWLRVSVEFVARTGVVRFLLPKEAKEANEIEGSAIGSSSEGRTADHWRKLAIIVEWMAFFLIAGAYALLVLLLVPLHEIGSSAAA